MTTDPIADMLTQIRNALQVKKSEVVLPYSKVKHDIASILSREGYVGSVQKVDEGYGWLRIVLKYEPNRQPSIASIKRISKPGRRVYAAKEKLPWVLNNYGVAIVSTSRGIMTNREARRKRVGGEVICEVY
ncbi:MAG: 30S ribosomal protein S8 [Patescibacteria group bacterium]|jgi:small subunit ribosomal protein S8